MAELTVTKKAEDLRVLFNQMKEVYYIKDPNSDISTLTTADIELPVLEDGVTFDTGAADIEKIKLTTGATWTAISNAGDSDIQFQVPSVAGDVNDLLMNKVVESAAMTATIDGIAYAGSGYDLEPKKVLGGLLLRSEDKDSIIFMPNIEAYANFVSEDGKPGYFNVSVTPLNDDNGASFYILRRTVA